MKTAMQELIEYYNKAIEIEDSPMAEMQLRKYRMKAQLLLAKEKKQIQKAFSAGYMIGEELDMIKPSMETAEKYYNQTYNQNK